MKPLPMFAPGIGAAAKPELGLAGLLVGASTTKPRDESPRFPGNTASPLLHVRWVRGWIDAYLGGWFFSCEYGEFNAWIERSFSTKRAEPPPP